MTRPSGSMVRTVAGGSLRTPVRMVCGAGHDRVEAHVVVQRDRVDRGVDAAAGQQRGQRRRRIAAGRRSARRYSGLMPSRSRPRTSRPGVAAPACANANMPKKWSTQCDAPAVVGLRDHLGVGRGQEAVAVARELVAQLLVVVDAAVEDRDQAAGPGPPSAARRSRTRSMIASRRCASADGTRHARGPTRRDRAVPSPRRCGRAHATSAGVAVESELAAQSAHARSPDRLVPVARLTRGSTEATRRLFRGFAGSGPDSGPSGACRSRVRIGPRCLPSPSGRRAELGVVQLGDDAGRRRATCGGAWCSAPPVAARPGGGSARPSRSSSGSTGPAALIGQYALPISARSG